MKCNTIIIGGGLGGLMAGATLSKFGKKVLLLEQHYIPGGCATTFKRRDFVMEVGLHEMDGLYENDGKVQMFKMLEVDKNVHFEKPPELHHVLSKNGEFVFPHGYEEAKETLVKRYPEDAKGINRFIELIKGIPLEIGKLPKKKWKQIVFYPLMPFLYPNTVEASSHSVGSWLDKNISNEDLKLDLTSWIVYWGDDPYTLSMYWYGLAQGGFIGGGGHFIKGGSQQLSNYLASFIEQNGGTVLLGKKAQKINTTNNHVTGVTYVDSFNSNLGPVTVDCDNIVANCAMPLVSEMLEEPHSTSLKEKISSYEEACSLLSVYIGVNGDLGDVGVKYYSTVFPGEDVKELKDVYPNHRGDWSKRAFVFVDYSKIDAKLAPEGKDVAVICGADYLEDWEGLSEDEYRSKKEEVAEVVLQRLEYRFPGIRDRIEYYEVGTPKTIKDYTLNPKGTVYGYAQTPQQSGFKRFRENFLIPNLYFASAWAFPGGGFTGAIVSGFLAGLKMHNAAEWSENSALELPDERIVRLIEKNNIAKDTIELTFEKPKGFSHVTGQYVVLNLINPATNELDMPFRSLSIVSHPEEPVLRFAMRLSDSSFKKSCDLLKAGDKALIFGPMGNFSLSENSQENIVFLIGGIGITPVIPMLKELQRNNHKGKVHLFYSNKESSTSAYLDEIETNHPDNFNLVNVCTKTDKRIDEALVKEHLNDLEKYNYYLVGTSSFIKGMRELLVQYGIKTAQIKEDDYG
ncbi:MAG: NAD(P)-binding protein [Pyrinomonadaceae bacterium]|nr:NAD(P)-binding protein [Pyrinomonadaceae bacterium]